MTFAESEPCGECGPCKDGKRHACVRVLKLDGDDMEKLARLRRIAGDNPGSGGSFSPPATSAPRATKPEPTTTLVCPRCDSSFEVPEFIAAFARDNHAFPMQCDDCRSGSSQESYEDRRYR